MCEKMEVMIDPIKFYGIILVDKRILMRLMLAVFQSAMQRGNQIRGESVKSYHSRVSFFYPSPAANLVGVEEGHLCKRCPFLFSRY